jgi:hypothetical protein
MAPIAGNRSLFARVVCVLAMGLVCAVGVVQAVHAHPDDSATSHHACSVCVTAHAGMNVEAAPAAPVMLAAALATPVLETSSIFRPAATFFIRPPPEF